MKRAATTKQIEAERKRLVAKLEDLERQYEASTATSARTQARLSKLAREIGTLRSRIDNLDTLKSFANLSGIK